ncbi:hypothetical protein QYE76_035448 [Lolium multiflorum]|uniref:Uncharacterized protein n=1 Tax=Lolium multiflorum TaxID=4521 RepID=A0AAD8QZ21_LOLMU|nr:hypothetical protein QYE76_035448 [Lolium multiflorum]
MASSSQNPPINLGLPPRELLTRENHPTWRSQVLPAIRGAQLVGLLDGTDCAPPAQIVDVPADPATGTPAKMKANPEYAAWISRDQIVLSYLLQSLHPKEVLPHVHRIETTAGVWRAIEEMFAAQSEAKVTNLLVALANTKKLQMTTAEFLSKMQRNGALAPPMMATITTILAVMTVVMVVAMIAVTDDGMIVPTKAVVVAVAIKEVAVVVGVDVAAPHPG